MFKNPAYEEENEWRFLFYDFALDTGVKAKSDMFGRTKYSPAKDTRNNTLIPYVKLDFRYSEKKPRVPLKEIVIGPKQNEIKAMRAIEIFLIQKGYVDREMPIISKSAIPYV